MGFEPLNGLCLAAISTVDMQHDFVRMVRSQRIQHCGMIADIVYGTLYNANIFSVQQRILPRMLTRACRTAG